jgi:hypothetical protein
MDNETRSWLVGVPFNTESTGARRERLALSRGQKRELAGFTGLLMASTVFFLTPLLVSAPAPPPEASQLVQTLGATLQRTPVSLVASPAVVAAAVAAAPRARSTSAARGAAPLVPVRPLAAVVAVTEPLNARARENAGARRKGMSGGLVRALVGSGRYRVQPFPLPASGG